MLALMEQLNYNLLFRWFVGLSVDDAIWDVTVFTKNRDRLLEGEIAAKFLGAVLAQPKVKALLSDEHFSVDGTLIQAWASMKPFRPKDGSGAPSALGRNGERDFHVEQRANDTHASTTDPEATLFRKGKGKEAKLCFMGPSVDGEPSRPDRGAGHGGGDSRPTPDHRGRRQELRYGGLRRRLAGAQRDAARRPEHDQPPLGDRRSDHAPSGLRDSQRIRKRIDTLAAAAYNLIRLPKLLTA